MVSIFSAAFLDSLVWLLFNGVNFFFFFLNYILTDKSSHGIPIKEINLMIEIRAVFV